jgi:hypothetical protein
MGEVEFWVGAEMSGEVVEGADNEHGEAVFLGEAGTGGQ